MRPLLSQPFTLWSPLNPDRVVERLREQVATDVLVGTAATDGFRLARPYPGQVPGRVEAVGACWASSDGRLAVGASLDGQVVLHSAATDWASAVDPFAAEADLLVAILIGALGTPREPAVANRQPVLADPEADGAEGAAPPSLEPVIGRDGVTFTLHAPWEPVRATHTPTRVTVEAGRLSLEGAGGTFAFPWGRVAGCVLDTSPERSVLLLVGEDGAVLAGAACAGSADDAWLAAYVDAQIRRHRPDAAEVAGMEQARTALGDLLGTARRSEP